MKGQWDFKGIKPVFFNIKGNWKYNEISEYAQILGNFKSFYSFCSHIVREWKKFLFSKILVNINKKYKGKMNNIISFFPNYCTIKIKHQWKQHEKAFWTLQLIGWLYIREIEWNMLEWGQWIEAISTFNWDQV